METIKMFIAGFCVFFAVGAALAVIGCGYGALVALVGFKFGMIGVIGLTSVSIATVGGVAFAMAAAS